MPEQGEHQAEGLYTTVIKKEDLAIYKKTAMALEGEGFHLDESPSTELDGQKIGEDDVIVVLQTKDSPEVFEAVAKNIKQKFQGWDERELETLLPRSARLILQGERASYEVNRMRKEVAQDSPKPGEITRAWKRFEKLTGGKDFLKGK